MSDFSFASRNIPWWPRYRVNRPLYPLLSLSFIRVLPRVNKESLFWSKIHRFSIFFFLFIFDRFDKIRIIWFPENKLIDKRKYLIYVSSYRIFDIFSQKEKKRKSFSNPRVENPWPKPCLQSQIETIQGYGEWRVNKIIGSQVAVTEARNSLPRDCRWDLTWKIQKWMYSPSNGTPHVSYISWLHFLCESDFKDVTNHVEKFLGTWIWLFGLEMD